MNDPSLSVSNWIERETPVAAPIADPKIAYTVDGSYRKDYGWGRKPTTKMHRANERGEPVCGAIATLNATDGHDVGEDCIQDGLCRRCFRGLVR